MHHDAHRATIAPAHGRRRGRLAAAAAVLLAGSLFAAPASVAAEPVSAATVLRPAGHDGPRLEAEVRRTEFGVPHVKADDWASLGYGYGYAFAQDNLCLLADMVVTANAERSLHFGATQENLDADLFHQQLIDLGLLEETLDRGPDDLVPGPSERVRQLVAGTAAGYNRHLRDVGGPDGVTDPTCAGGEWVRPIDELDLWRTYIDSAVRAGRGALASAVVAAQPPAAAAAKGLTPPTLPELPPAADTDLGSNAYGLGREVTEAGSGMLLGNPHFPWQGRDRFYQMHLTIPGEYDMIGAALSGQPVVQIGHNETMGWSHTVSTARRFTLFELQLVPGNPTRYVVDGEERDMVSQEVEVRVAQPDGTVTTESRTMWSTEYGPLVSVAPLEWSETTAFALRDVNEDAGRAFDGYIEMGRASDVRELDDVLDEWQHLPWINTIAADSTGEAYYGDHSVVPHVDDAKLADCITPIGELALELQRVFVLDGSRTACQWGSDPDARVPGIFGPGNLPTTFRDDYVLNSNDSYWLTHPDEPLEGFAAIIGRERYPQNLRTRIGHLKVEERMAGTDGLPGTGFTLERLQEVTFSNRVHAAELTRDDLVDLCRDAGSVVVEGAVVDLTGACDVLEAWDLRDDLDSRGAHVFRQFVFAGGLQWAVPFDEDDPVRTPNTLDVADPAVLTALGTAVRQLNEAGIELNARLGDLQREPRGDLEIPIHGGPGQTGVFNVISAPFDGETGYPDVRSGTSYVLTAEFTPEGPRSQALLSYSNSTDPTSPHFFDQTLRYSAKEWIDQRYREEDILADPELSVVRISQGLPDEVEVDALCANVPADLDQFEDTAGTTFEAYIACLAFAGITLGAGPGSAADPRLAYLPEGTVTRQQMASFLTRLWDAAVALDPAGELVPLAHPNGELRFTDVDADNVHLEAIERLAAAGVTLGGPGGRPADRYGPLLAVSRGQMASFITRTLEAMLDTELEAGDDYFHDDDGNVHEPNIDVVAEAGIALGDEGGAFRPDDALTRGAMAAFLVRTLASLEAVGVIDPLPAEPAPVP
jgi:acyl-homoserine-lactone acylase